MKELQAIVEAFQETKRDDRPSALATVIEVRGSTYRRAGARMLITQSGQMVGSISGGCLEADVFERAQQVMVLGEPTVVTYDTTSGDDLVWGLALGCNGLIRVFIEPLTHQSQPNHLAFLAECFRQRQVGVLATVVCLEGRVQAQVGARLLLQQDGTVSRHIETSTLTEQIFDDAWEALHNSRSRMKVYSLPMGEVEVSLEVIQPPTPLLIFGAGHDVIPVARFAKELGWHVTVVDSRPAYATPERFPMADKVLLTRPEAAHKQVYLDSRTAAVVMTHNYLHDLELLKTLLPSPVGYLGILGPKSRTERLLQEAEIIPTDQQLQRLYGPIGLDIGADTPEAIALAIVAEIQAVLANRSGGLLRDRQGPIHSRSNAKKLPPGLLVDQGLIIRSWGDARQL